MALPMTVSLELPSPLLGRPALINLANAIIESMLLFCGRNFVIGLPKVTHIIMHSAQGAQIMYVITRCTSSSDYVCTNVDISVVQAASGIAATRNCVDTPCQVPKIISTTDSSP